MAQQGIVDFDQSDGLSPHIVQKLNYNFRLLGGGAVTQIQNNVVNSIDVEQLRVAARDALAKYNAISMAFDAMEIAMEGINAAAITAIASAEEAKNSAQIATLAANGATFGLSEIEQVIGTLNWIAEHGTYVATTDTAPVDGRIYYTRSGSGTEQDPYQYTMVTEIPFSYALTQDVAIDPAKTYYTRSGAGTSEDPYVYTAVEDPDVTYISTYYEKFPGNPSQLGYYYLVIDESVQNYLASHLAQTNYGLNLMVDDSSFYITIGTVDGTHPMGLHVIDANGVVIASFNSNGAVVGSSAGSNVALTSGGVTINDGVTEIASFADGLLSLGYGWGFSVTSFDNPGGTIYNSQKVTQLFSGDFNINASNGVVNVTSGVTNTCLYANGTPVSLQGHTHSFLTTPDTRNNNQNPSWYFSNYGKNIVCEFKNRSTIGAPGSSTFVHCLTLNTWDNASGGYPSQIAIGDDQQLCWRTGNSATGWGTWRSTSKTVLYNNASGTNGTVTLSASAANYNHMRIYYSKTSGNGIGYPSASVDVYSPDGKYVTTTINLHDGTYTQVNGRISLISGTSIGMNRAFYINASSSADGNTMTNSDIYIKRVEAWNE